MTYARLTKSIHPKFTCLSPLGGMSFVLCYNERINFPNERISCLSQPPLLEAFHSAKEHRTARLLYLCFFFGVGAFAMFLNVYYRSIGMSGTQIGLMSTLGPAVGIFSPALWGILRDNTGRMRLIFSAVIVGSLLSVLIFAQVNTFPLLVPVVALFSVFYMPILPLIDSNTLRLLGARGQRYGRYRVWGAVGFTVASVVFGFLYERRGLHTMFYIYPLVLLVLLWVGQGLTNQPVRKDSVARSSVRELVWKPEWLVFAVSIFLLGFGANGAIAFVSVKIMAMGGSASLVGLSWTTTALLEVPLMLYSEPLLRKMGATRLLSVAFAGYALRILLYGLMPAPGWAPFVNFLHGISFVPLTLGTVAYVNERAPDHLKATSQGLLASVMNFSNLTGVLLAGWMFDQIGPVKVFLVLAGVCLAGLVIFVIGQAAVRKGIECPTKTDGQRSI
jgi:PPP family 3-phenylpropionic acid transporter